LAIKLFLIDYFLFFIGQYGVIKLPLILKPFSSLLILVSIARLFILGHDACHGSFTNSKKLNKILGWFAFFPALTLFKSWAIGHNSTHHGYTNFLGRIDSWQPLCPSAYQSLDKFQKILYRIYRSPLGGWVYYMKEWWRYLYFPSAKVIGAEAAKKLFIDFVCVNLFFAIWISILSFFAVVTNQAVYLLLFFGFLLPFIAWNMVMGLIVYLHHTHPKVKWYENREEWFAALTNLTATVHVRFPQWISTGIHHIMEHPAHHLNQNIPCYNLKAAQNKLEEEIPAETIVIQDFSWKWYLECTRVCKLYDFENHEWVGFPEN
jgi:omega-6 fatty acid desaturase (delta-12 desaturase)